MQRFRENCPGYASRHPKQLTCTKTAASAAGSGCPLIDLAVPAFVP